MKKTVKHMFLALVLIGLISGCESFEKLDTQIQYNTDYGDYCEVYYIDNSTQALKSESITLEDKKQNELVEELFNKMIAIGKTEEKTTVVPDELEINKTVIDNGTLYIDFGAAYNTMTAGQELAFRTAAVYTFTSLNFIDYVYITIDGKEIKMTNGTPIGKLGREDVVIDSNISAESTNYTILTLYFRSADGSTLSTEIREVKVNSNLPVERYVIEQIIEGPDDAELKQTVPSETKIRDISTADGVCYVDLSMDFVNKQLGNNSDALAAVYSITNSLCEIDEVTKVQFLIEGEKIESYKNIIDFSKPIDPNYDIEFE